MTFTSKITNNFDLIILSNFQVDECSKLCLRQGCHTFAYRWTFDYNRAHNDDGHNDDDHGDGDHNDDDHDDGDQGDNEPCLGGEDGDDDDHGPW